MWFHFGSERTGNRKVVGTAFLIRDDENVSVQAT